MELEAVVDAVAGVPQPHIAPDQGAVLYEHIRRTRPARALELGTARGVSGAYITAAMEANGHGHLVSVDSSLWEWRDPGPEDVLGAAGLLHRVTLDRRCSTYTWFLKEQLEQQTDEHGACTPLYDFVFLDGSKNWTIDGLAVLLIERLLRPGGWLLLDDLDWSYGMRGDTSGEHYFTSLGHLSKAELDEPHIQAVFDLLVRPHPSFTEMVVQDGRWGWARKAPDEPKRVRIETTKTPGAYVFDVAQGARRASRALRRALRSRAAR